MVISVIITFSLMALFVAKIEDMSLKAFWVLFPVLVASALVMFYHAIMYLIETAVF